MLIEMTILYRNSSVFHMLRYLIKVHTRTLDIVIDIVEYHLTGPIIYLGGVTDISNLKTFKIWQLYSRYTIENNRY